MLELLSQLDVVSTLGALVGVVIPLAPSFLAWLFEESVAITTDLTIEPIITKRIAPRLRRRWRNRK
jgi:hypothetical protein